MRSTIAIASVLCLLSTQTTVVLSALPVVIWHGVGEGCCDPHAIGGLRDNISKALDEAYVLSLKIGRNAAEEEFDSILMHPDKQIKEACDVITADAKLKDGFNAVGLSQGGLLMRGLIQRCPAAKVKNLITLGSPHQGVYGLPNCGVINNFLAPICEEIRKRLSDLAYQEWAERMIVQAGFWHNPLDEDTYRNKSSFLADVNNENSINQDYITNLQKLEKFVMVKFEQDATIMPSISSWFGFYKEGQAVETETLEGSKLYTEERLGLKKMKEDGKIIFISTPGQHVIFTWDWFKQTIVDGFLK